jgi:hypothetical protein
VTQSYRRHWTMPVELGLTATLSIKMDLVTAPTVLGLIAPMQSTAIFRRRVKLKAPVILLVPQLFLHLTLVSSPQLFFTVYTNNLEGKKKRF